MAVLALLAATTGGLLLGLFAPARAAPVTPEEPGELDSDLDEAVADQEDREEQLLDQALAVSTVNLALGAASIAFPPLLWIVVPSMLISGAPLFKLAYTSVVEERKLNSYALDILLGAGMLMSGFIRTEVLGIFVGTAGRKLLAMSESKSRQSMRNLLGERVESVWILAADGQEVCVPFDQLKAGDVVVARAGGIIPADGTVLSGTATIDQHTLTGESVPIERGPGEEVLASTLVVSGRLEIRAERTGSDTIAMGIGELLNQTAEYKASVQSRGEAVADRTAPAVLALSAVTWPLLGPSASMAILANTFGYKMRVFAPATMLTYIDLASQDGILIKDGRTLELLSSVDTLVFDKTGTLTVAQPVVGRVLVMGDVEEREVLRLAAAVELRQSHPIAAAILTAAEAEGLSLPEVEGARVELGLGITAQIEGLAVHVGSARFMHAEGLAVNEEANALEERLLSTGHSSVMVGIDGAVVGVIELIPATRPEATEVMAWARGRGLRTVILSGDHEAPTRRLAEQLGVDDYRAGVMPDEKSEFIGELQAQGHSVCFVGDGINDTIALKRANVSVSLSGATTAATDMAQVVLLNGTMDKLERLFSLAEGAETNLHTGLAIATVPSVVCIGGVLFLGWGVYIGYAITLSALFAGIANSTYPLLLRDQEQPEVQDD